MKCWPTAETLWQSSEEKRERACTQSRLDERPHRGESWDGERNEIRKATGGSGKTQNHWTKDDIAAAWQRFERMYVHDPVAYRFLCGHSMQDETDEDALDYNIIGVWLVCHRKYCDWSTEKSYDLAWILEFMQAYHMTIPRHIKRTKFYRKKMKSMRYSYVKRRDFVDD